DEGGVARHQEGDALELIGVRLERQPDLLAGEDIFERRLQEGEEAVLEENHVARRAGAGARRLARRLGGGRRRLRGLEEARLRRREDVAGRREAPAVRADLHRQLAEGARPGGAVKQWGLAHGDGEILLEPRESAGLDREGKIDGLAIDGGWGLV